MQQLVITLMLLTIYESAGQQICSQSYVAYQTFYAMGVEYYGQQYQTGCGLMGWSRCSRYRTLARSITVSMRRSIQQYRITCCAGYSGSPPNCQPICSQSCANGGTCIAPNICNCLAGWTGQYCTNDIDECTSGAVPCQQICTNTEGSFQCSCRSGYTVDGTRCNDINECNNSPSPCAEVCTNNDGSYVCSCTDNSRTVTADGDCVDVDECATPGRCQHICNNRVGGFFCTCHEGYQLVNGTNCTDINECSMSPNPCDQICTNNEGSFVCSCNNGYVLDDDQTSCNDVDECLDNNGGCEQICNNAVGSFECSCQSGYDLGSDGFACNAQQCRPRLIAPQNGNIMCDGDQVTMTTCNFSCDPGYSLVGSMERRCQHNNSWSGSNTSCDIMSCEVLQSPSNGFIVLPCNREFQSVCSVTCEDGYYTEGPYNQSCEATDNGIVEWSIAPLCRGITPCGPNPCQHNGECVTVGDNDFSCDCLLTGYTGVTCNIGVLTLPSYPALTIGVPVTVTITAVPEYELIISITSSDTNNIIISPSTVNITNPTSSATFSVEAHGSGVAGLYSISYRLSGVNADDYSIPSDSIVFVRPMPAITNYFEAQGLPNGELTAAGCFEAPQSLQCQNDDQQINIYSTSQWSNDNNAIRTNGVVHLVSDRVSSLLAIAGANISVEQSKLTVERLHFNSSVSSESTDNCTSFVPNATDLDDFLRFKALSTSFLSSTFRLLPTWIQFAVTNDEQIDSSGNTAYLAYVVTREELINIVACQNIITNENTLHLVVRHDSNLTINVPPSEVTYIPTDNSVVCLSVELCSQTMSLFHIGLPSNIDVLNQLQFMNDLSSAGWRMDLDAVTFATSGNLVPVNMMETYWTGLSYQPVSFSGAHIGLGGSFTREFSETATTVTVHLLGDVYWRVDRLDQIFEDLLRQRWTGAASGIITIVVTMPFYGSTMNISFTAPLAYISIGGLNRPMCGGSTDPAGIFATTNISTFNAFNDIFPPSGTNCQLNPYVYMNGNNLILFGFQSSCNDLQLEGLKFSGLTHYYLIVAGVENICNYNKFPNISNPSVLVESFIINRNINYQLNNFLSILPFANGSIMRTSFAQDTSSFSAVTQPAQVSLLGSSLLTSLKINNSFLSFSGNISLYNMYPSTIQAMASANQSFYSLEISLTGIVGSELGTAFQNSINNYLEVLVEAADDRIMVSTTGLQRANNQLNASRADVNYQNEMLTVATMEYEQAVQQLVTANQTYNDALENVSEEMQSMLNGICEMDSCDVVCNAGLQCNSCQVSVERFSQTLEESGCFIQVTERIAPFEETGYCWSEVRSIQETVFGNCINYSCNLRTEYMAFQELVQEECLVPSYMYETRNEGYSCTVAVDGDRYVYNVSQLCCSPSQCSTMSPDKECVQSNVACRLVRRMLPSTTIDQSGVTLDALDDARMQLSVAEVAVEEKRILRDLQMKAYEQSLTTLAVVNVSVAAIRESQDLLQNEVLAGILPLYNQIKSNGSTENIIVIQNITYSTITTSPQSLAVLPLTLTYSTFTGNVNTYTAEFDFSSIDSSLTQLAQEIVTIFASSFIGSSQRKRATVEVDPNLEFFQQQCNSWINSREYVNDIYQSLELAVNSSGSTYSVNTISNGNTMITGINTTALDVLNISVSIDELYSQVMLEDDYIALVNLTDSVNTSINQLVDYIKFNTFINWQSGQELLQNSSSDLTGLACYGLTDCLTIVADILQKLVSDLPSQFRESDFDSFEEHISSFVMLGSATNMTITEARDLVTPLYNSLNNNNVVVNYWCASPPNITEHPQSSVVTTINSTITLRCNAISEAPVSYYWSKDGLTIDGIASNIFTLRVDSMNDEGSYVCHVVNHISVTESAASNVDIQVAPMITEQPSDQEVYVGSDNGTMISCRASGDPTPGYQWYFRPTDDNEYVLLLNETSSVLSIDIRQLSNAGSYYCNTSNPQGHVISNPARVTILDATIPIFNVNISLVVECNAIGGSDTSNVGSENPNVCDNISFINVNILVDNLFSELFNTVDTIVPVLNNYSISENALQLLLQVFSRNVTNSGEIIQPFREIAANTIAAKNDIRNTIELLRETVSNETLQFSDDVYTLEPINGSLMISELTELCPLGQYLHSSNIICINCPPGSQGVTGSTCTQCTIDTFQDQQGQATCRSCPSGQGTISTGAVECTDVCAPGSYSTTGLSPCTQCSANTYQSSQRSTLCMDCPPGSVAPNGSANCTEEINDVNTTTIITTTVTPTNNNNNSNSNNNTIDDSEESTNSVIPIVVGVSVAVVITNVVVIVVIVIAIIWYCKHSHKYHISNNTQSDPSKITNVSADAVELETNPSYGTIGKEAQQTTPDCPPVDERVDLTANPSYTPFLKSDDEVNPLYSSTQDVQLKDSTYDYI